MSIYREKSLRFCVILLAVASSGCAELFLTAGNFLGTFGDGLNSVGTCLSPLTPIDLNVVFGKAPVVVWTDGSTEIADTPQPEVQAFFDVQVGQAVLPVDYLGLRFYQLGSLAKGEVIQIEPLSDVIDRVALYDADYRLIPAGYMRDFDGRRQTLQIPVTRDISSAYLRVDLEFLADRNESLARLTRRTDVTPPPSRPQTVVLHFGGQDEVTFRNGYLLPAQVGAIEDPEIRQTAVEQFRSVYAPYNVTVLTDDDPAPAVSFSVVYIGPTSLAAYNYGLAELVDSRNAYLDDVAVVDTDQVALDIARLLGEDIYGRAIGMIAAHEMGHLLGLEHVADADALMTGAQCQGSGPDVEQMLHRKLKPAPIIQFSSGLQRWTIGYQDAGADLLDTLGLAASYMQ